MTAERDSSSQPSDLESDALPLRHAASEQWRLDREWHRPSGGGMHVAVASGLLSVGQKLQGEWTRSPLMRREGVSCEWRRPLASATSALVGRWHGASAVGTEVSRGFDPQSLDSESRVLTVTPRDQMRSFADEL